MGCLPSKSSRKLYNTINFIFLPNEIKFYVLQYFNEKDILTKYSLLSKEMNKICHHPDLWEMLTRRRFGNESINEFFNKVPDFKKDFDWFKIFLSLFSLFSSHIVKKTKERLSLNGFCGNLQQQWRLLYRGSEDGFDSESFHALCDDHAKTLVIVQTLSDCVFGGYTPCKWHSYNSYACDTDNTFLFALKYLQGSNPVKLLNNGKFKRSIYGSPRNGPMFGFGPDLSISSDCNNNKKSFSNLGESFTVPNHKSGTTEIQEYFCGDKFFQVKELEVYQKIEETHVPKQS